jgi:predicted lysophospholipase L1 biosynthesis ABC-type transport system permease subunit
VRTLIEGTGAVAQTGGDIVSGRGVGASEKEQASHLSPLADLAMLVILLLAGCSLAVAVSGSLVERRQPFALLRLAGMQVSELRRIVLIEAAAPLVLVATVSAGLGLAASAAIVALAGAAYHPPPWPYFAALAAGLAAAVAVAVASTLPLLGRLTLLRAARFE